MNGFKSLINCACITKYFVKFMFENNSKIKLQVECKPE